MSGANDDGAATREASVKAPSATSIGNVAVYVSDLERAERFYVDGLGLEVLARIETAEVREVIVGSASGGSNLMLAKRTDADGPVHPDGIWKVFLFTDDAAGLQRRAIEAGAEWVADPQHLEQFEVTIAFVKDPDGYLIEIGQQHT
jgi:lactoylglutathione lyase